MVQDCKQATKNKAGLCNDIKIIDTCFMTYTNYHFLLHRKDTDPQNLPRDDVCKSNATRDAVTKIPMPDILDTFTPTTLGVDNWAFQEDYNTRMWIAWI